MPDEVRRMVRLLEEAVRRSPRGRGQLERAAELAPGTLDDLFGGRAELEVRHLLSVARELGLDPVLLFQGSLQGEPDPVLDEVERAFLEVQPQRRDAQIPCGAEAPAAELDLAAVQDLVSETIRDELARLARGQRPGPQAGRREGAPLPARDAPEDG
jgi:hypothetical protein